MIDKFHPVIMQLKETCKITGARWAVWLNRGENGWDFGIQHGLSKPRQTELSRFIRNSKTATWLAGTFSSGRTRSRHTGASVAQLGCQRIYVFPNTQTHCAILVGADQLEKLSENFFRVLALDSPQGDFPDLELDELDNQSDREGALSLRPLEVELEASYDPEEVLDNVLEYLAGSVACESALISIRSGDIFRIASIWNYPQRLVGYDISLRENETLAEIVNTRLGLIFTNSTEDPVLPNLGIEQQSRSWMGAPIVIGKRVIGHLAFASSQPDAFAASDLRRVTYQSRRLAYVVENAIVFAEAARYLQQLALLNELASAASLGGDMNDVAYRVTQRLRRTFRTSRVGVYLQSPGSKTLREYGTELAEAIIQSYPSLQQLAGHVVESGFPLRVGDARSLPGVTLEQAEDHENYSALAVPLKYRGKVIGALALENEDVNAFSPQDEQLLVLIASHLAGLFENIRLNEETRERARNLSLIHQVVTGVLGLTDINEIARVAAELMVKGFSFELASVVLPDDNIQSLVVRKHTGEGVQPVQEAQHSQEYLGITAQVLKTGNSLLIHDISLEPGYVAIPGWQAGSEMSVPLREGEHIFGALDVQKAQKYAFTENDLLTLEALAGVISSVVLSARRYQQLQDSFRQLQAVRETALDIAGDLDLDAMLKRVVHRARELVGARGAELGLLDEKEGVVQVVVSETPWYDSKGDKIPLLAGVAGRVAVFGEPLVISNYNTWKGRLYPEREAPFKTVAGVPLRYKGEVIGTLTVIDDRPDWEFRSEHVQLLELLAPQVTVWIRNARLYQELQERIEAQKLAENRLIRSARLAAVGEMAAGVAHELNNPLTSVSGFVELVLDELPVDSKYRADLELVLRESQRARGVVRRLLDFSRPVENRRVRTDLNDLVNDVLSLVHHLAHTGGVEVHLELNDRLPWVSIDPGQIKQVLLNLIHNAIQAMPHGGILTISTTLTEHEGCNWAAVAVSDNGDGISSENLERIFEPFFTTRLAGSGTGLGLSVSYGIVTDHGGIIEVDSQVGRGSCFTVYLPIESERTNA